MKYKILVARGRSIEHTHAVNRMNKVMCGYERVDRDDVTTVSFNPAITTAMVSCKGCIKAILEATDESLRIHTSE